MFSIRILELLQFCHVWWILLIKEILIFEVLFIFFSETKTAVNMGLGFFFFFFTDLGTALQQFPNKQTDLNQPLRTQDFKTAKQSLTTWRDLTWEVCLGSGTGGKALLGARRRKGQGQAEIADLHDGKNICDSWKNYCRVQVLLKFNFALN